MKRCQSILVVDDDQEILKMVSRILELEGYGVAIAADGEAALALLEEHRPDLVILDIMMPNITKSGLCSSSRDSAAGGAQARLGYIGHYDARV